MIRQLKSTPHFLYVVTDTYVAQQEASTRTSIQRWDLPSVPRSDLLISSCNDEHWSIVCASHLRTHDMALPHGFALGDAYGTVTFVSMHEIGVSILPDDAVSEIHGVRLVHQPDSSPSRRSDVYQSGNDVCVRRIERNGFMQRLTNVQLLYDDAQGILVAPHASRDIILYDAYGRNPRTVLVLPAGTPLAQVRFAIAGSGTAVLGNVPYPGDLYANDPWRVWYILRRILIILVVIGVLLSFYI